MATLISRVLAGLSKFAILAQITGAGLPLTVTSHILY